MQDCKLAYDTVLLRNCSQRICSHMCRPDAKHLALHTTWPIRSVNIFTSTPVAHVPHLFTRILKSIADDIVTINKPPPPPDLPHFTATMLQK